MKKFRISLLCVLIAVAMSVSLLALKGKGESSPVLQGDTAYLTAENLALNKGGAGMEKLTDGDFSTSYKSYRVSKTDIAIDLKTVQPVNSVVLKEEGLNIKSFTILISEDGETYETVYQGDKIEYHRLCTFDTVNARYVRILINEADRFFQLKEIEIYNQPKVNSNNFRTTGYVLDSDFYEILQDEMMPEEEKQSAIQNMLANYNFAGLTHVNFYCGVTFDEKGNVFIKDQKTDQQKARKELAYMVDCMRAAGRQDLKIMYVIGLNTGNPAVNPAMSESSDVLIQNLNTFANETGFDGIDIDYEFPQSDYDYQVFGDFLIKLKAKMITDLNSGADSVLSCAFGTRDIDYPKEVVEAIDIVNMMTYDIFDQDGQHASFWSCAVQGAKYLESIGFSKQQINIGIPFYGTQTDALMEQYIYKNASKFDYYENTYTFASYYDGSPTEVYFNSPAMVRDKTAYALLNEYGGIMVWHFSCDTDYASPYSLWRAAYKALDQFGGVK